MFDLENGMVLAGARTNWGYGWDYEEDDRRDDEWDEEEDDDFWYTDEELEEMARNEPLPKVKAIA